jgi:hypothetical protein
MDQREEILLLERFLVLVVVADRLEMTQRERVDLVAEMLMFKLAVLELREKETTEDPATDLPQAVAVGKTLPDSVRLQPQREAQAVAHFPRQFLAVPSVTEAAEAGQASAGRRAALPVMAAETADQLPRLPELPQQTEVEEEEGR